MRQEDLKCEAHLRRVETLPKQYIKRFHLIVHSSTMESLANNELSTYVTTAIERNKVTSSDALWYVVD